MNSFSHSPPHSVLQHFGPHTRGLRWRRAVPGFSGANVWRGDSDTPTVALKAWPINTTRERLRQVHAWLARVAHFPFVPTAFAGIGGETVCVGDGRLWDCCRWQPGAPRITPTAAEVEIACEAVWRLHAVWASSAEVGPCPGVQNRLRILKENEPLLHAGPSALPPIAPQLDPLLRRAVSGASGLSRQAAAALQPWTRRNFAIQPCIRDLRAEHVLFEEDRVAGIIDFGAMAVDSPAADLARFLGDYSLENCSLFAAGLAAYRRACGEFGVPDELILLLARSGAVCSLLGWLVRLVVRRETISDPASTASRLARLLGQVEQIQQF